MSYKKLCISLALTLLLTGCAADAAPGSEFPDVPVEVRGGLTAVDSAEESSVVDTPELTMLAIQDDSGGALQPLGEEIIWYTVYTGEGYELQLASIWESNYYGVGQALAFRPIVTGENEVSLSIENVCVNGMVVGVEQNFDSLYWYALNREEDVEIKTVPFGEVLSVTGDAVLESVSFTISGGQEDAAVDFAFPEGGGIPRRFMHQLSGEQVLLDENGYKATLVSCGITLGEKLYGTVLFENNSEVDHAAAITGIRINDNFVEDDNFSAITEITTRQYSLAPGEKVFRVFSYDVPLGTLEEDNLIEHLSESGSTLGLMLLTDFSQNTAAYGTVSGGNWYPVTMNGANHSGAASEVGEAEDSGILIFDENDVQIRCIDWGVNKYERFSWKLQIANNCSESITIKIDDSYAGDESVDCFLYEDIGPDCILVSTLDTWSWIGLTGNSEGETENNDESGASVMMPRLEFSLEITGVGGSSLVYRSDEMICIPALELPYEILLETENVTVVLADYSVDQYGWSCCRLLISNGSDEPITLETTDGMVDGEEYSLLNNKCTIDPEKLEALELDAHTDTLPVMRFHVKVSSESGEQLCATSEPVEIRANVRE